MYTVLWYSVVLSGLNTSIVTVVGAVVLKFLMQRVPIDLGYLTRVHNGHNSLYIKVHLIT